MSKADITIVDGGGRNVTASTTYRTEAGATDIKAGEPVVIGGTGGNYVAPLATAQPTTTNVMLGLTASDSTHTASADGTIDVYVLDANTLLRCAATTPGNIDTDAKLLAILNDRIAFDLTSSVYTIDENQGDVATNGLRVVGGDIDKGTLDFRLLSGASNQ